jgi:pyruvate dehydrogenase E1 component
MGDDHAGQARPITPGVLAQIPDADAQETTEWLQSLESVVRQEGAERARYLLLRLLDHAGSLDIRVPQLLQTDYINTIPTSAEPDFPGDEAMERKILAAVRWNNAAIVTRANRPEIGVGGHIATYSSAAELYEVGFNHFFRGKDAMGGSGDQLFIQGHAAAGIYARAFLEGRLTEKQLDAFRQEVEDGGLSSYPHPRLMRDFWEFPTVSMGLGPLNAIYQARFNRYLAAIGIKDTADSRVYAFIGDGEMDEPEAQGALSVAAREGLDNLTFVLNCNLQRLDGPVRGNGSIIQEMERVFRGAGWNVIKLIWGREWDQLLAADTTGELVRRLGAVPDGQWQTFTASDGAYVRERLFGASDYLRGLVADYSDDDLVRLVRSRGGHDYRKVYAAYAAAQAHRGQPTVIIANTIKGWMLGPEFEGRNAVHQMKKISEKVARAMIERLGIDHAVDGVPTYYHPGEDSKEVEYLLQRRRELGGSLPQRVDRARPLTLPAPAAYERYKRGFGDQQVATTMALVRLVKDLLRSPDFGRRIVPIIPDEARTFGMDSMFPSLKIYSPRGQTYDAVDRDLLLSYKESTGGQILHEGITEAGAMGSFHAAGSSYATHGEPMIPFYIFYSMFGFQRTGDSIWSAADQRCRGFLIGATAGRTTLNGEGLQHEDGHSTLLASTNPACVAYDPSFAFEIPVIFADGLRRMYGENPEDIFYYLTVYNEPVKQPPMPEGLDEELIRKGLYLYGPAAIKAKGRGRTKRAAQLLASGSAMKLALEAQRLLADDWQVAVDVWSAPGWNQLRAEGLAAETWNRLHPTEQPRVPYVTEALEGSDGPIVAVSDWMKAVPDQIARFVPSGRRFAVLGTDGFGRSDTRKALRRHFRIDAGNIAVAVLHELAAQGAVEQQAVADAIHMYRLDPEATTEVL